MPGVRRCSAAYILLAVLLSPSAVATVPSTPLIHGSRRRGDVVGDMDEWVGWSTMVWMNGAVCDAATRIKRRAITAGLGQHHRQAPCSGRGRTMSVLGYKGIRVRWYHSDTATTTMGWTIDGSSDGDERCSFMLGLRDGISSTARRALCRLIRQACALRSPSHNPKSSIAKLSRVASTPTLTSTRLPMYDKT